MYYYYLILHFHEIFFQIFYIQMSLIESRIRWEDMREMDQRVIQPLIPAKFQALHLRKRGTMEISSKKKTKQLLGTALSYGLRGDPHDYGTERVNKYFAPPRAKLVIGALEMFVYTMRGSIRHRDCGQTLNKDFGTVSTRGFATVKVHFSLDGTENIEEGCCLEDIWT